MIKKILIGVITVAGALMMPNVALAAGSLCDDMTPEELAEYGSVAGCTDVNTAGGMIDKVLTVVLSAVGIIAVGVMIYGGVQYMLSSGDPTKAKRARDILIYGVVGLIICLLAYAVVRFVLASIG